MAAAKLGAGLGGGVTNQEKKVGHGTDTPNAIGLLLVFFSTAAGG
jgi:hypothetical protein